MKVLKKIDVYLVKKKNTRPIEIVQSDTAIQLEFTVKDFEIPTGTTATLFVLKPSGKFVYQENKITVNGNVITVDLENQAIIEKGNVPYQLTLKNGTDEITTFEGLMMVDRSLKNSEATESKTVIRAFEALTEEKIAEIKASATAQIALVVNEGNNQIKAVQNASQNEQASIEEKGAEVLATIPEDYQATYKIALENKRLKAPAIIQTVTGTEVTITDGADNLLADFEMVGKTEQKQYSGYQLFDASRLPTKTQGGATVTNNGDGSFTVSGSGELTENLMTYYELNEEEINRILVVGNVVYVNGCDNIVPVVQLRLYNEKGNGIATLSSYTSNNKLDITEEIANSCKSMRFYIFGEVGKTITPGTIKPMFYIYGDGTWEPFTGGQPSPSPQYPQSLNHTGDCVELIQPNSGDIITRYPIPCKEGDIIDIKTETENTIYLQLYNNRTLIKTIGGQSTVNATFIIPNNITHCKFILNKTNINLSTIGKIELTVNGKYVGQIVERGKNLLNFTNIESGNRVFVNIPSGTYTFSALVTCDSPSNNEYIRCYYADNSYVQIKLGKNIRMSKIMQFTQDVVIMQFYSGDTTYVAYWSDVQLEEGTEATPYKPYQEHIATFYMDEPLRDGDRLVQIDELWQVERNSTEVVFDGSADENWWEYNYTGVKTFAIHILDCKIGFQKSICTHFSNRNACWGDTSEDTYIYTDHDSVTSKYFKSGHKTIEEWKAWLSKNPITVEYQLAAPTYEILDNQSQIALNSLKSFNGVTYVKVDSRVKANMVVDYVVDTKMYIDKKFAELAAQML